MKGRKEIIMTNAEIKDKYNTVGDLLENAVHNAESVEIVGEEESAELSVIKSMLREINTEFKQEIDRLESSSEWDKFCIAFFGETNAGKSTVIESLRIIYDEEQRRLEQSKQENEYKSALVSHCEQHKELLTSLAEINDLLASKKDTSRFLIVLKNILLIIAGIAIGFVIAYFGF